MVFEAPQLDDQEISVLARIAEMNASLRLRLQEPHRWSVSLSRIQFARAVQGSTGIDGVEAPLDDTAATLLGELPIDIEERTRLSLKGYRDVLTYAGELASDDDFSYSSQLLKGLHFIMGSYDLSDRPGRWREGPSSVLNDNTGETTYKGPDASEVPTLMKEFVSSLQSLDGPPTLVRAAMAHLNLVTIRPFPNGNGKLGRCLQSLVLARQGTLTPTYFSVDEYLSQNIQSYFDVLAAVGAGSWQPDRDARPWVRFMLTAHLRQAQTLKRRLSETEVMWSRIEKLVASRGLPDRTVVALFDASLDLRIRSSTYRATRNETADEEITETTASRDLRQLVEVGLLEGVGEKRGRHYVSTTELKALRQSIIDDRKKKERSDPFLKG
jgi:Fic family protein